MNGNDQRKAKRRMLDYNAQIDAINGGGPLSCIIKDVSETGARVATDTPDQLPDAFILCLTNAGTLRRHCRVIWRSKNEAGVSFVKPPARRKVTEMGVSVLPTT